MIKKQLLFLLLLILCVKGYTQQGIERQYTPHNHLWMDFSTEYKLTDWVRLGVDMPYRRQNMERGSWKIYEQFHYYGIRFWTTFDLSDEWGLSLSPFAYIYSIPVTYSYEELDQWEDEIRFTVRINYAPSNAPISHRYSLERRYEENYEDTHWQSYRLRYRIRFNKEIFNAYSLIVDDEIFINMGKDIEHEIFGMNRFYTGIRKEIYPELQMTLGYRNILEQQPSGESFYFIHALDLSFSFRSTLFD